jgi:hypothetical protein
MTALADVIAGLAAGAVGTALMDLVWFARYRRRGGQSSLLAWEFSAGLNSWDAAPAPAHVGKLMVETVTGRSLSAQYTAVTNNAVHWTYGLLWGGLYGLLGWAFLGRNVAWGPAFGLVVWASSYVTLPLLGLYKPMWQYDIRTLTKDLSAHLAYGLGTAATFALLVR